MFSMLDIYSGNVSYLHDGSNTAKDSFRIVLSDSTNKMYRPSMDEEPTNKPSVVHIEISSVDDGTPILTANRGLNYLQQEAGKVKVFSLSKLLSINSLLCTFLIYVLIHFVSSYFDVEIIPISRKDLEVHPLCSIPVMLELM